MSIENLLAERPSYGDKVVNNEAFTDELEKFIDRLLIEIQDLEARIVVLEP